MRLKALALAALATAAIGVSAQNNCMFENPDNRTFLGVRVGMDISSAANGQGYYSNNAGFQAGAIYQIPLWKNLYFEPGLSIFYNDFGTRSNCIMQISRLGADGSLTPVITEPTWVNGAIRNFGFRIPLIAGYHFDFAENLNVSVFTGPEINFNILARYHNAEDQVTYSNVENIQYIYTITDYRQAHSLFGTNGYKRFDLGWKLGVGVTYQRYYLGLSGTIGITTLKSHTLYLPHNIYRNLFSITLGYNF